MTEAQKELTFIGHVIRERDVWQRCTFVRCPICGNGESYNNFGGFAEKIVKREALRRLAKRCEHFPIMKKVRP